MVTNVKDCQYCVSMNVYELEESKAFWLALRADVHMVLGKYLNADASRVRLLEEELFASVVQDDPITHYHMQVYRELMSGIIMAPRDLKQSILENYKENVGHLMKSLNRPVQVTQSMESKNTYETESQRLFHEVARPKLMALAANTTIDLPACPTCQTNEYMAVVGIQTRSGDEAETLFPKCMKCNLLLRDHPF